MSPETHVSTDSRTDTIQNIPIPKLIIERCRLRHAHRGQGFQAQRRITLERDGRSETDLHEKAREKAAAATGAEAAAAEVPCPDPARGRGRREVLQPHGLQPLRHDRVLGVPRGGGRRAGTASGAPSWRPAPERLGAGATGSGAQIWPRRPARNADRAGAWLWRGSRGSGVRAGSNWGRTRGREGLGIGFAEAEGVEFEGGSEMAFKEARRSAAVGGLDGRRCGSQV